MFSKSLRRPQAKVIASLCLVLIPIAAYSKVIGSHPQQLSSHAPFDVIHYDAQIEPNIAAKTVNGTVNVRFISGQANLTTVDLDCGALSIDAVKEKGVRQEFVTQEHRLRVTLAHPAKLDETREIEIVYHGLPKYGIRFFPERSQVYTIFSTSQWMVCIDAPDDRASLTLKLILPSGLTPVANGRLISKRELPDKKNSYQWEQQDPVPTYTFGFAAGPYHSVIEKKGGVEFQYVSANFTDDELRRIFRDTPDMLEFYESRAGIPYAGKTYTQVLAAGNVEQEMSSFTALGESYGKGVLAKDHDIWLGAHEFAHQWWGNMVTCRNWNHFWLNEGMANFMTAAYLEHRFGRADYLHEIESYRTNYEKVRAVGKDKSLVFPDWQHPTSQDRALVYDKGAYALHLLREEIGERAFWKGIRSYTRKYFGKSVVTADFQTSMEQAAGKSLAPFFAKWIYLQ